MCWYSALTILLLSWNNLSSSQLGFKVLSSFAILLCSLINRVCMAVNAGCSLARLSPAPDEWGAGKPSGKWSDPSFPLLVLSKPFQEMKLCKIIDL